MKALRHQHRPWNDHCVVIIGFDDTEDIFFIRDTLTPPGEEVKEVPPGVKVLLSGVKVLPYRTFIEAKDPKFLIVTRVVNFNAIKDPMANILSKAELMDLDVVPMEDPDEPRFSSVIVVNHY